MLLLLEGELYKAPIENPKRILDVGTGTGIWAVEMAEKFPNAKVLGIDLSPIQPEWVPPNCRFIVDDAEESWPSRSVWDLSGA
jgi:cyclopropane fatty-acyl-phospholipid synthase-like methyltransferase